MSTGFLKVHDGADNFQLLLVRSHDNAAVNDGPHRDEDQREADEEGLGVRRVVHVDRVLDLVRACDVYRVLRKTSAEQLEADHLVKELGHELVARHEEPQEQVRHSKEHEHAGYEYDYARKWDMSSMIPRVCEYLAIPESGYAGCVCNPRTPPHSLVVVAAAAPFVAFVVFTDLPDGRKHRRAICLPKSESMADLPGRSTWQT